MHKNHEDGRTSRLLYATLQGHTHVVNNVDKTSQVYGHHDKMVRTKTHKSSQNMKYTKTQQTLRDNFFCVFRFFCLYFILIFNYLKDNKLFTALVRSMKNIGGFKPVFRCSKPHTSSTFSRDEKEKNVYSLFVTRPLRHYKNDKKVKKKYKIKTKQEGMKKRESLVQNVFYLSNSSQIHGRGALVIKNKC